MNADLWEDITQKTKDDRNIRRNSTEWITFKGRKGGWSSLDGQYDLPSEIEMQEDELLDEELHLD